MKQPKDILKTYFETGDKPTEQQFSDLIDSFFHQDSGHIITKITQTEDEVTISLSDGTVVTINNSGNGNLNVDSTLNSSSRNPVQNQVLASEFENLAVGVGFNAYAIKSDILPRINNTHKIDIADISDAGLIEYNRTIIFQRVNGTIYLFVRLADLGGQFTNIELRKQLEIPGQKIYMSSAIREPNPFYPKIFTMINTFEGFVLTDPVNNLNNVHADYTVYNVNMKGGNAKKDADTALISYINYIVTEKVNPKGYTGSYTTNGGATLVVVEDGLIVDVQQFS